MRASSARRPRTRRGTRIRWRVRCACGRVRCRVGVARARRCAAMTPKLQIACKFVAVPACDGCCQCAWLRATHAWPHAPPAFTNAPRRPKGARAWLIGTGGEPLHTSLCCASLGPLSAHARPLAATNTSHVPHTTHGYLPPPCRLVTRRVLHGARTVARSPGPIAPAGIIGVIEDAHSRPRTEARRPAQRKVRTQTARSGTAQRAERGVRHPRAARCAIHTVPTTPSCFTWPC